MAWRNDELARLFQEMAELLLLQGDTGFRVRAYDRGARALSGYGADLTGLSERELAAIPGVGKAIAAKVREYLDTGRVAKLEELRAEVPTGLRALLRVPGLGPRKARLVHEALGVGSPEELTAAVAAGRVAGLPGMGQRTEANLRRALERMAGGVEGIPLAVALPLAETLRDRLAAVAGVDRVEVAGSLRRMKAAVHDLDLLAAGDDPAAVTRAFADLPEVAEVAALGDTKVSIRTRDGYQVDLRVVRPAVWGAALQYFTGSAAHNVRIRELAVKAGFKLSEYGLFERGGELVVAEEEAVVYDRLGLEWVAPVLREDRGEVEAARRGELPALVAEADLGGFDVLVASVHDRLDQPREQLTARLLRACEHPAVNVIGHPTGRRIGTRAASDVDLEALYKAAARTGTALEVNGSPHRLDLGDEQVRLAHRFGVWLAFGSDSHGPGHLANIRFAVATAGRGWTTADRVVNALPPAELRRFLAKGRHRTGGAG